MFRTRFKLLQSQQSLPRERKRKKDAEGHVFTDGIANFIIIYYSDISRYI